MQNIKISEIREYLDKEPAVSFLFNLLQDDFDTIQHRPIEAHKADDTHFTIDELLRLLQHTELPRFNLSDAVNLLDNKDKAMLFDLIANDNDDTFEEQLQYLCKRNLGYRYRFKIQLLRTLEKSGALTQAIRAFIS